MTKKEKHCTAVVVLPFSEDFGEITYSFKGSDYQIVATIVLLKAIYDRDLNEYLAGGYSRPIPQVDFFEPQKRAFSIEIVKIIDEEAIVLGSTYSASLTLLATIL